MTPVEAYAGPLTAGGYRHVPDPWSDDHEFFSQDGEDRNRAVNLHVCTDGSDWERKHLAFRDALRAHPEDAAAYADLKRGLAAHRSVDRASYTEDKTDFVERVTAMALRKRLDTEPSQGGGYAGSRTVHRTDTASDDQGGGRSRRDRRRHHRDPVRPALPEGGTVGVCAPSGPYYNASDLLRPKEWWEAKGYRVRVAEGTWAQDDYVAGTPEGRAAGLHALFADPEVDVIQVLWGGTGAMSPCSSTSTLALIAANPKA